jgi:hypothetical protein
MPGVPWRDEVHQVVISDGLLLVSQSLHDAVQVCNIKDCKIMAVVCKRVVASDLGGAAPHLAALEDVVDLSVSSALSPKQPIGMQQVLA